MKTFELSSVKQEKVGDVQIDIYFSLNDLPYSLELHKVDGIIYPQRVYHESSQPCHSCETNGLKHTSCRGLSLFATDLFYQLIEHSSIRLEWLYISYEPQRENSDTQ